MTYVIQAVYENGVLKPLETLALGEHQQVRITVEANATAMEHQEPERFSRGPTGLGGALGDSGTTGSALVPITTLAPEPFDLLREVPVVVQRTDDGYLATFFDANIGMTGDTQAEAVSNLRLLLVDVFDELETDEARLGPQTARQLAVLRTFMRRRL